MHLTNYSINKKNVTFV